MVALDEHWVTNRNLYLPRGYKLDEVTEPEVVVLRRPDGSVVAVFSAWGASRELIERAAWEDYERRDPRR